MTRENPEGREAVLNSDLGLPHACAPSCCFSAIGKVEVMAAGPAFSACSGIMLGVWEDNGYTQNDWSLA